MVKSYLKYEQSRKFGLVYSGTANVLWTSDVVSSSAQNTGSGRAIAAANEDVLCWDIKKGEVLGHWKDDNCKSQVTAIAQSEEDKDIFAIGYDDGSIRLWDSKIAVVIVVFNGHRSAITKLAFDKSGARLASGSKDTDIIIWDLIAEVGLIKLRGHKDQVTGLHFIQNLDHDEVDGYGESVKLPREDGTNAGGFLLTTSKDALVKLWDIDSQYCIETHVAQSNGECWSLAVSPEGSVFITGGNDGELTVWSINSNYRYKLLDHTGGSKEKYVHKRGVLFRQAAGKSFEVKFHPRLNYFAIHGGDKAIDIWRMRSEEDVKKSLARKRKRKREKLGSTPKEDDKDATGEGVIDDIASAPITEIFVPFTVVRTGGRVRSFDWIGSKGSKTLKLLAASANNQLEVYEVPGHERSRVPNSDELAQYTRTLSVDMPGHRADIRALALSSDDRMLASASNGGLKIWNIRSTSCIRTFECGYALCCTFLPGDKVVIVGTKSGELELFDVASAALLNSVKAHEAAIWALQVHPDGRSIVSGSADKSAKLWNFEVVQEEIPGTKRTTPQLRLVHKRTLKVSDDILSLRFSPDARLLAVALLDNTVKVFFTDSLKLFLNLYGHKLPVLNMDISFDSKLIVTCSADKNVRLWGLDFGDCHKAFFAHQDSVLQVAFVPHNQDGNGHHFFSSSKDRTIKYWDGDKFEQIQRLDGHHGEIWALAVSRTGELLVSASHDKGIRVWEQSDEQIFLEEEKEKQLEELYESTLTTSLEQDRDEESEEVGSAVKQTIETLMAGEKVAEALELGIADLQVIKEWELAKVRQPNIAVPIRNPLFMALGGISAEAHVLGVLQKIHAAALQDALLVLPFAMIPSLFTFLDIFATKSMNITLTCRILFFTLKTHHKQIVASKSMKPMLDRIKSSVRRALKGEKDEMGYNLAALRMIGARVQESTVKDYIDEKDWEVENGQHQRKRGFVQVS